MHIGTLRAQTRWDASLGGSLGPYNLPRALDPRLGDSHRPQIPDPLSPIRLLTGDPLPQRNLILQIPDGLCPDLPRAAAETPVLVWEFNDSLQIWRTKVLEIGTLRAP